MSKFIASYYVTMLVEKNQKIIVTMQILVSPYSLGQVYVPYKPFVLG